MGKCIFFDGDGTILDIKKGIPQDVKDSVAALKRNGHRVFLCTGRSRAFVPQDAERLDFDGIISNMGGCIEYHGKMVYDKSIDIADANRAVTVLRKYGLVPVLEGNRHMFYDLNEYTTAIDWYADLITKELGDRLLPIKGNEDKLYINKISAKRLPGCNADAATRELSDIFDFIWHEGAFVGSTIECIAKGHSKGLALLVLINVLGIPREDTVAFGDSNNDIDMFQAVNTKIAMGDASTTLIKMADYVTGTLFESGISRGLSYLGLL